MRRDRARATAGLLVLIGVLASPAPASAHNLDEYLQAATFSVGVERVRIDLVLIPGAQVAPAVVAAMDTDGDGALSEAEQRAYAEHVRSDLSLSIDGRDAALRVVSLTFPPLDAMRDGTGEVLLVLDADVPSGGPDRTLAFENRHQRGVSSYIDSVVSPRDGRVRVTGQERSHDQSSYRLHYTEAVSALPDTSWRVGLGVGVAVVAGLWITRRARRAPRP